MIKYYRGVVVSSYDAFIWCVVLVLANASVPLSCNFVGEFLSLLAALECSFLVGILASSGVVLSTGYSIYMFWGSFKVFRDFTRREFYSLLPLIVLIDLLGISPCFN